MIICRTPFRISFFGGGTDYPSWYREHGGSVLATTIDKYCYLSVRYLPPFFEHRYRLVWSKIENCESVDDITHPAVRELIKYYQIERCLEIHHVGDLPARSGMGSSSAFTVGLLNALNSLQGRMLNKQQLAQTAIHLEQEVLKETVGSQDQVSAAYGGLNHITFSPSGDISVVPVTISRSRLKELQSHLMLFYTGIKRTSCEVAKTYVSDMGAKKRQLRIVKDLVNEGLAVLASSRDITGFGELLREGWETKRSLGSNISNSHVDSMMDTALRAGAIGGKLTGAGGGGFLLLFVPPERQARVREALKDLLHVPFQCEFSGSQIIFAEEDADYTTAEAARALKTPTRFLELSDINTVVPQSTHLIPEVHRE